MVGRRLRPARRARVGRRLRAGRRARVGRRPGSWAKAETASGTPALTDRARRVSRVARASTAIRADWMLRERCTVRSTRRLTQRTARSTAKRSTAPPRTTPTTIIVGGARLVRTAPLVVITPSAGDPRAHSWSRSACPTKSSPSQSAARTAKRTNLRARCTRLAWTSLPRTTAAPQSSATAIGAVPSIVERGSSTARQELTTIPSILPDTAVTKASALLPAAASASVTVRAAQAGRAVRADRGRLVGAKRAVEKNPVVSSSEPGPRTSEVRARYAVTSVRDPLSRSRSSPNSVTSSKPM